MVARPEVDAALAEATAAMQAHFTDDAFERQVALVKRKTGVGSSACKSGAGERRRPSIGCRG